MEPAWVCAGPMKAYYSCWLGVLGEFLSVGVGVFLSLLSAFVIPFLLLGCMT